MEKTLLVAINSKFIHSNLAVRYLYSYYLAKIPTAQKAATQSRLLVQEYNINQSIDYMIKTIVSQEPAIVAFSCYLWNIEMIRKISETIKILRPECIIIYGGPEVSYTAKEEMQANSAVDYIIMGEGEVSFYQLRESLLGKQPFDLAGICYRQAGQIQTGGRRAGLDLDEVVFPYYDNFSEWSNKILYYETSRGCPFACAYCLSSIERGVRFRSLDKVLPELDFFLSQKVRQVKLVDRTFNAKKSHFMPIVKYLIDHDNSITNFHFEVAPELMDTEFIDLLGQARSGLFQLEMGVQSIQPETLAAINRNNDLVKIEQAVASIKGLKNIHLHLDLIAGLPLESYEQFKASFNYVFGLRPDMLQLGFLKVLKGSALRRQQTQYGIEYRHFAPYEVLKTNHISYFELEKLKTIEQMVELFYNSKQFIQTIERWLAFFESDFSGFEYLAQRWLAQAMDQTSHNNLAYYDFMYAALAEQVGQAKQAERIGQADQTEQVVSSQAMTELVSVLTWDYCLREKPKRKRDWMPLSFISGSQWRLALEDIRRAGLWQSEFEIYNDKQLGRRWHMDQISPAQLEQFVDNTQAQVIDSCCLDTDYIVVNYDQRDFITNNGSVVVIRGTEEGRQKWTNE